MTTLLWTFSPHAMINIFGNVFRQYHIEKVWLHKQIQLQYAFFFQHFFHDIIYFSSFSTTFLWNISQNPQSKLRTTKVNHSKKTYFFLTFAKKVCCIFKSKSFLNHLNPFFFFTCMSFVFASKVNMCHWSFPDKITLKRFAVIA